MKWHSLATKKPTHGQRIIPYHPDMGYKQWLLDGILPIYIWDESKHKIIDSTGYGLEITHWLPVPLEPTVKKKQK